MTLDDRAVRQMDDMRPGRCGPGLDAGRPHPRSDVDTIPPEAGVDGRRVPRVILRIDGRLWRDQDRRDAIPGIDLGHLHAGGSGPEDDQALRQRSRGRGLAVRPRGDRLQPVDGRDRRVRADRDDDVPCVKCPVRVGTLRRHGDRARAGDPRRPPDDDGSRRLQAAHVAGVARRIGSFAIDHVVAPGRGGRPVIVATGSVDARRVQQRLGRHAGPVGA